MSWRKYFTPVNVNNTTSVVSPLTSNSNPGPAKKNYSSFLPDIYTGAPNRIERYMQYDTMDMDSEVNAALDILAEFSSQKNRENSTPFNLFFKNQATNSEISILREYLQQWTKLQKFDTRIFRIVRNVFKYGDCFFIRDPETFKWFYIDSSKIVKIIVNESEGKLPEQYVVRDLNPNFMDLVTTTIQPSNLNTNNRGTNYAGPNSSGARGMTGTYPQGGTVGTRFDLQQNEQAVNANHVVHLSLSEGLDNNYPFGNSLLENIFKVFKQKELLEDAILIYRIQRAPERRIFYIDVGNMPSHLAMSFVERVKNEIHQRRIPSSTGGGQNVIDSAYNPLCLDLETKIPLLDGRTLTLSELIDEFNKGKENWAYSCNPETGEVVPGVINWAGITRKNTEVIKLTFDNGKELICTPDHKIPVFGRGFIEAKDLTVNDSLISFNTRMMTIARSENDYQQVWNHASKSWKWTHRIVGEFFRNLNKHQEFTYLEENINKPKTVIHHKDSNRYNNDPRNLTYMDKTDHILFHSAQKKDFWESMSDEFRLEMSNKTSNTLKQRWQNMTQEQRISALWNIRSAQKKAVWMRKNDPDIVARYKKNASISRKMYIQNNPQFSEQLLVNLKNRVKIKNQKLVLTFEMLQKVVDKVKSGITNKEQVILMCDSDHELLGLVKKSNSEPLDYKNSQCKIDFTKFGYSKLDKLLYKFGYKNWKAFVKEIDNFNHKVVKIEKVFNRDTGTITIDGTKRWHDYHTFAIDSGIFIKNSINEDYFFPTTAEGRGSKVETLPGGTNLGEIDDLKYFTNKLFRGLRIPSSYLPTGADDSQAQYNDGRVGTAYIQELRFNNYCMRLQSLMQDVFDQEFKLYLYSRGVNIDSNLFELKFQPPQNFASYRQAELDNQRINTYGTISQQTYISKRFALKRYLGLSEEEIAENERLWAQENGQSHPALTDSSGELRGVGVSQAGIEADTSAMTDVQPPPGIEPPPAAGGPAGAGPTPAPAPGGAAPLA
jgi:hypothetical protein